MDEVSDEKLGFLGHQLLKKPQVTPLWERMERFVEDHEQGIEFKQLRSDVASGKSLSEIVREERL